MSKKFSIAKTIDRDKLNRQIDLYMYETGEINPYLFMNKETSNELKDECLRNFNVFPDATIIPSLKGIGVIALYQGYKVYENNDLKFGEVEIR